MSQIEGLFISYKAHQGLYATRGLAELYLKLSHRF